MDTLNPLNLVNPVAAVGTVLKAGASAAQEVPNKALGRAMGAAGGDRRSRSHRHRASQKTAKQSDHHRATAVADHSGSDNRTATAVQGSGDSGHAPTTAVEYTGAQGPDLVGPAGAAGPQAPAAIPGQAAANPNHAEIHDSQSHRSDNKSKPSGWDKARRAVFQGRVKQSAPESRVSSPQTGKVVNRSSTSDGSLSRNTTGPMQFLYSRGGKFAATVAMAVHNKKGSQAGTANTSHSHADVDQQQAQQAQHEGCDEGDDVESGRTGFANGMASNRDKTPGNDAVSRHGAGDPKAAAGGQVNFFYHSNINKLDSHTCI